MFLFFPPYMFIYVHICSYMFIYVHICSYMFIFLLLILYYIHYHYFCFNQLFILKISHPISAQCSYALFCLIVRSFVCFNQRAFTSHVVQELKSLLSTKHLWSSGSTLHLYYCVYMLNFVFENMPEMKEYVKNFHQEEIK